MIIYYIIGFITFKIAKSVLPVIAIVLMKTVAVMVCNKDFPSGVFFSIKEKINRELSMLCYFLTDNDLVLKKTDLLLSTRQPVIHKQKGTDKHVKGRCNRHKIHWYF